RPQGHAHRERGELQVHAATDDLDMRFSGAAGLERRRDVAISRHTHVLSQSLFARNFTGEFAVTRSEYAASKQMPSSLTSCARSGMLAIGSAGGARLAPRPSSLIFVLPFGPDLKSRWVTPFGVASGSTYFGLPGLSWLQQALLSGPHVPPAGTSARAIKPLAS